MQDLNDLYYFVHVVEQGGFAAASRALGIPKSKLSRRIAWLEERLGVQLILRSTRSFAVTEIGSVYLAHCKAMLVEADAAEQAIARTQAEPRGAVRLTCPVAILDARVGSMLADYMARYPGVELHLQETNRRVDVVAEGIDLAIRVRPPPLEDSDLVMRILAERSQCLLASPGFLRQWGRPASPAQLTGLPSLALGTPQQEHAWSLYGPEDQHVYQRHQPRLVTRGMMALRTAAVAGVGIVQLPRMMVHEQLKRGELEVVLPEWAPRREIIHVVFASRRGLLPAVRLLIDHLAECFANLEEQ